MWTVDSRVDIGLANWREQGERQGEVAIEWSNARIRGSRGWNAKILAIGVDNKDFLTFSNKQASLYTKLYIIY